MANFGYRRLISEKSFLSVRLRARQLMKDGSDLVAILYKDKKLIFKTASGTYGKRVMWTQTIEISDATIENILNSKSFRDVETLIKESGLKIHCNCPAFLYWGYKYMAWKRGYGLEKELRRPIVRNPKQQGYLCFVGGTRVLSRDGYKNIEDIRPGDLVFTHKGRLKKVISVSSHATDNTVVLRYGSTKLQSTLTHPFWASPYRGKSNSSTRKFNVDSVCWMQASDLTKGDFLISPRLLLDNSEIIPAREAFFAGLYAGDGSMSCRRLRGNASVHNGEYYCHGLYIALDSKYMDKYKEIFNSYGIEAKMKIQSSTLGTTGIARVYDKCLWKRCLISVNFTSSEFGESKRLDILSWDEQAQKEFIKGFFLADGTIVNGAGKKGSNTVYCTLFNTNKQMMEQILIVLKQWFDVELKFYDRKPFEEHGNMIYPKRMYYIRFTGSKCSMFINTVLDKDILMCKSFGLKGYRESSYCLSTYVVDGVVCTPKIIKEVSIAGKEVVYNLQVEDDESYIVEDVAVHNCKHLYLVMALYPFWSKALAKKFRKWAEEKVEKNEGVSQIQRPRMNAVNRDFVKDSKLEDGEDKIENEVESGDILE